MSLRTSMPTRPCLVMAAAVSILTVAPAASADQGAIAIVAIAPAFCRVNAISPAPIKASPALGTSRRACNTVNDALITLQVSNLDGAALQLDGANIAVSATGAATLSPAQLAGLSDLRVVSGRGLRQQVAINLMITPQ